MSPVDAGFTIRDLTEGSRTSVDEAAHLAASLFGIRGTAERLDGEYDENFALAADDGRRFVLKLAPPDFPPHLLDLQTAALEHVRQTAPEVGVPRPVRATTGEPIIYADVGGRRRAVRLLSFIPGELLAALERRDAPLLRSLGAAVAALDHALEDFDHPAAHRALQWDLARAGELRPDAAAIADPARRSLVTALLDRVEAEVLPQLPRMRTGVIHGDPNDHNAVVSGDRVVGLIDLGDMVYTATVCDLAIACAYAMTGAHDPLGAAAHVVAGYDAVLPLRDEERRVLFPLALTRLAMSVIISASRRARAPGNDYYTVHEARAWRVLEELRDVSWHLANDVLFGLPSDALDVPTLLDRRRAILGPALSLSYRAPLHLVRGWKQYLYDANGAEYLDAYNNVTHVGHSHPRVVEAIARQAALLNTNTRYLHRLIGEYAERLSALLPAPLRVCHFVNSGSEANELALRMARAHTGQRDVVVSEGAYHGNTQTLIDVSPYKYAGPGGAGRQPWVHEVPMPDTYRGPHRDREGDAGARYAAHVAAAVQRAKGAGGGVSAFLFESLPSVGGQIIPPPGYLAAAYEAVRAAGGVCIADEVQVGLGRVGTHMWGFEMQGVVPDIVVLGKPIGNGHPMGAVITTREVAASFANGMEYFNTFGGNPVSMAAGLAVLDVLEAEGLREHALRVGARLLELLAPFTARHALVGDVRGAGLFVGVELVRDRETREPAGAEASDVVNAMRDRGILIGTDGPHHNVLKVRPPMPFDEADAAHLVDALDATLRDRDPATD